MLPLHSRSAWIGSLALLAIACDSSSDANGVDAAPAAVDATVAAPIETPVGQWTWVDFPESACDDGSPTGIGVLRSATSDNVLIYLNGGGACWDYVTCFVANFAVHGPFGKTEFDQITPDLAGSVLSRTVAASPFKDWNMVYVPYCTGDIHGGDNVPTYTSGSTSRTYHHVGHRNVLAYVARLAATFPHPPRLAVSGASAGGFGATYNYATIRDALAPAKGYLIDDSGPALKGDTISPALRDAWLASWHIDLVLDPLCGAPCRTDLSAGFTALSTRYPADRFALLSSLEDSVIGFFFQLSADAFHQALVLMAHDVLEPTANFRSFFIAGGSHTMLGFPSPALWQWLSEEVTDAASWTSVAP